MIINFIGHSSFLLKTSTGKRILTDPYNLDIGYKTFDSEVDLITISHLHFDHSYTDNFSKEVKIIRECIEFENTFCKITGFQSYHDNYKGQKRGDNIIFKIEADDLSICHLGDLGHILDEEMIKRLGNIDVLFVPVGEIYTITLKDLKKTIEMISPKYIIPMHYKTAELSFTLKPIDEFLLIMKEYPKERLETLSLSKEELTDEMSKIIILEIFKDK